MNLHGKPATKTTEILGYARTDCASYRYRDPSWGMAGFCRDGYGGPIMPGVIECEGCEGYEKDSGLSARALSFENPIG